MQTPLQKAFYKIESLRQQLRNLNDRVEQDIAVIGIAINFPEAHDPDTFWNNLISGKNAIRPIAPARQRQVKDGLNKAVEFENRGYLDSISGFDNTFFGITEKDAMLMNPAQRLFLKNAWQVLEDGGYSGNIINGKNVGVFVGYSGDIAFKEYTELIAKTNAVFDASPAVGNSSAILPGRISHLLNLHGPSMVIDTACSSSLVAVYEAVKALQNGSCEMAIAGGVQIEIFPYKAKYQVGFESADGCMKPFDKNANGTVTGEGVGSVLLKPLKKAIEDRDHIYAVIKGGAVNHDGLSSSITAPNLAAQADLLKKAWSNAKIKPEQLTYIETHGTGTYLGDPIELGALQSVLGERSAVHEKCYAGSVKANIGHLFASAGIASLIKCVLLVNRRVIPRQINLESPIDDLLSPVCPVVFNTENITLPPDAPLLCGVSSFGFSGTNCHLVVSGCETAVAPIREAPGAPALFTISGKTKQGLLSQIAAFRSFLAAGTKSDYRDICFTRNLGRAHHKYRCAFIAESLEDIAAQLQESMDSMKHSNLELLSHEHDNNSLNTVIRVSEAADRLIKDAGLPADRERLQALAEYYLQGADINWEEWYSGGGNRAACPVYVFEEKEFWVAPDVVKPAIVLPYGKADIREELIRLAVEITGLDASEFKPDAAFFELGVDSLVLLQMIEAVKSRYRVNLQIGQFYDSIVTLEHLANYLEQNIAPAPPTTIEAPNPAPLSAPDMAGQAVFDAIMQRLDRIESKIGDGRRTNLKASLPDAESVYYGNPLMQENKPLNAVQTAFLNQFIQDYQHKTAQSKDYSSKYRACFSDWINSIDYRHSLKELLYPIVTRKAEGARAWDLDGNEYIDIGLGYGVSFFGNNPAFIKEALAAQLDAGFELAFQTKLAGDIAAEICALTGVERVSFSNTGTEAVMAAMRIARAKTRKPKVVIFTGAYHGTFDGVLGMKGESENEAVPISSGTPLGFMEDLLVLNFGAKESLDTIAEQAGSIAAVLMEPVQSRKPDVQLRDFIRELRNLTERLNIALIFDEIITGFRIGAGGAQAYFDIQADIVTYGKVIGGGMPIGIVAGKRQYLDLIDGGIWQFGDDSYPAAKKVLFGGTFCKHPLALAAAAAVIRKIKTEGDTFYPNINALATYLSTALNHFFQTTEIPVSIVQFGSLFRFEFKGKYQALQNPLEIPLFFYLLNYHGVYTWERRICFLSTEHTRADVDQIISAVQKTVRVMKSNGWFEDTPALETVPQPNLKPLFHAQLRLWMLDQLNAGQAAYNLGYAYKIEGDFKPEVLEKAFLDILHRHEILRGNIVLHDNNPMLLIHSPAGFSGKMAYQDMSGLPDKAVHEVLRNTIWAKFNLEKDPLIRLLVVKRDADHFLAISVHHIIADGWSVNVLFSEIGQIYQKMAQNTDARLPDLEVTYSDLLAEETAYLNGPELISDQAYWLEQLGGDLPKLDFPVYKKRPLLQTGRGKMNIYAFPKETTAFLLDFAKQEKISLYTLLLGLVNIILHKYTHQEDIIIGTSVHGRKGSVYFNTIGNFINNIALRSQVQPGQSAHDLFQSVKKTLFDAFEHQQYPFDLLVERLKMERDLSRSPVFDVMVQIESGDLAAYYQANDLFAGLQISPVSIQDDSCERDLFIEFVHSGEDLSAKINYNIDVLEDFQIQHFFDSLLQLTRAIQQAGSDQSIGDLDIIPPAEAAFLDAINQTETPFPSAGNFVQCFERQARENGARPALVYEGRQYAYESLNRQANQLARYLINLAPAVPLVGVLMNRGPQMVAAILAIWKAGKAYVPIDPDYPVKRILEIAEEAKITLFVTDGLPVSVSNVLREGSTAPYQWIDFSTAEAEFSRQPADNLDIDIAPDDLAYIIFTSGSTGRPKGAMVEHIGMLNHMYAKINDLGLGQKPSLQPGIFPTAAFQPNHRAESAHPASPTQNGVDDTQKLAFSQWLAENLQNDPRQAFNIGHFNRDHGETIAWTVERNFDPGIWAKVLHVAGQLAIQVEELLFGAVCLLVHKYTDCEQVTLDVAFEIDGESGASVNCLPVVVNTRKNDTVETALQACAQLHRQLSSGRCITFSAASELVLKEGEKTIPAIEKSVLFQFQETSRPVAMPSRYNSFYDLEFDFMTGGGDMTLRLAANASIFEYTFAIQILDHAETLISNLTAATQTTVAALEYIGEKEKLRIMHAFNATSTSLEAVDFIRFFEKNAGQFANQPALIFEGQVYTYDSINKKANRLARLLENRFGTMADRRVGILMARSEKLLVALLAVLKTGAAYVPFDINFPRERVAFILSDAAIDVLIVDGAGTSNLIDDNFPAVLPMPDEEMNGYSDADLEMERPADRLFSILYTSGTTGVPKGVLIRNDGISALFNWGLREFSHDPFDHVLACTPVCFDVSMFELFFPLVKNKTLLFLPDQFLMEDIQKLLDAHTNIAIHTSPTFVSTMLEEGLDLRNVSVLNLAGEPVPVSFRRIFNRKNIEVRNLYGPCETTVYSTCYLFDDTHPDIVPIGKPLQNEQIYLVDSNLALIPAGGIGEICIAGVGLSEGYLNRPELSAEKFVTAPFAPGIRMYRTGDFGRYLADGNIEFLGRKDNQVKVRGYRIELGEIENVLNRMDGVIASVVDVATDRQGDKHLLAYYLASDVTPEDKVRGYLIDHLPHYMVPYHIMRLEVLPKTINGKIDKSRLPKPSRLDNALQALPDTPNRRSRIPPQVAPAVIAQNASHCFDISVWQMFTAHLVGGKTVIYNNDLVRDALAFIKRVGEDEVSVLELVPSYLNLILDLFEARKLDTGFWAKLSCVISTGETLKGNLVNRWFSIFPHIPVVNAYGPTEASDDITHHIIYQPVDENRPVPVGKPVQNMKIYILDAQRHICPVGVKGTIHVAGIGVGKGYIHQPEKTAAVFTPSPFRPEERMYNTGDIGRYLPDGNIEFFGRTDAQIKIRGNRIELGEIDTALTSIENVKEAITMLREYTDKDPVLVSYVTCRQKTESSFIRTVLAKLIPLVPDEIIIIEAFPLNANGKVDRKALLNLSAPAKAKKIETSADNVKGVLRQLWADVLGHHDFSDSDSFFEQGGNSLKLMKLFRFIDDRYPEKIKIPDLFRQVTVAEQAHLLAGEAPVNARREQETIVELDF